MKPQALDALWTQLQDQAERLAAERQDYQDFFHGAPDASLITDVHATIREANGAAGRLLGVTPRFLEGKPLAIFIAPGARRAFRARLSRLGLGEDAGAWSAVVQARDGASKAVRVSAGIIRRSIAHLPNGFCLLLRPD
jgi:PAS domain S-box-containing protein